VRSPFDFFSRVASVQSEDGFGLIELVVASTLFIVVSAPLTGVLLASITQQKLARERTLAAQTAESAIESIRALPYESVGVQNGNPSGTVAASVTAAQLGIVGLNANVQTKISYVNDAPTTSYLTMADYKKVVVTVLRATDSKQLTQEVTYVAPPGGGAVAGQNQGIVLAQVIDFVLNMPLPGATVTLSNGPSPTRNDAADATGKVAFPALLPTNGTNPDYDLTVTAPGYTTLKDDVPPSTASHTSIVGGQTFTTILRVYKAATIIVVPKNADGSTYTGAATATIRSSRGAQSLPFSGGAYSVTTVAGELVVPNLQYTVRVLASNGQYSTATTLLVPNSYPTDLTSTFPLTLTGTPGAMPTLTVKAVNSLGQKVVGATVNVNGGPGSNISLVGTTDATGAVVFSVPSSSSPQYSVTVTSGALTGTWTGAVTANTTTPVTVR
jgi:type II secretory pathway pseudopilin PulG